MVHLKKTGLKDVVVAARELGATYSEVGSLMGGTGRDLRSARGLFGQCQGGSRSSLVKLGIALVAFPEPSMVSDAIGCGFILAGLAYSRLKPPPIYVEDIYSTIEREIEELKRAGRI